jgi:hypothetical protein
VDQTSLAAFGDELEKISGFFDFWRRLFGKKDEAEEKNKLRANYMFSPKAGPEKWDRFAKYVSDPRFLQQLGKHPEADEKLLRHATGMHELAKSPPINTVKSEKLPGKSYEIRSLPNGELGCTCPDWRFKGTTSSGYACKHIRAHRTGQIRPGE